MIVPQLVSSIVEIAKSIPTQLKLLQERILATVKEFTQSHPDQTDFINDAVAKAVTWINTISSTFSTADTIVGKVTPVLAGSASKVTGMFEALKDLGIGAIIALYFLSKRTQLAEQATMIVRSALKPAWAEWVLNEVKFADRMFNSFFMGKLMDSAIVGLICFVGCLVMGFKNPLLLAVIVGVTNIIPFFGPFIGAVPCVLLLLLDNPIHALMFLVFIIVLQQVDGNVIGPRILGESTGLSALWVMFGILLFGGLWGVLGMLIGVPLMAVIYDIIRQLTFKGLREKGYGNQVDAYIKKYHLEEQPKRKARAAK
jgi:predicted PurR-regulated permease PerM